MHIARKVEWGFTPTKQVLYEKGEKYWRIVKNFKLFINSSIVGTKWTSFQSDVSG